MIVVTNGKFLIQVLSKLNITIPLHLFDTPGFREDCDTNNKKNK